ncbi:MAG: DUF167 domain-containing protein [Candidatus Nanoarchaeia archaeon]|nr:DUF167 domain-containing protein [Candidatus Nanoarchaeia archaeon]
MNYIEIIKEEVKNNKKKFYLLVKTNKNNSEIIDYQNDTISLNLKEKPIEGKANNEIIKFFKKELDLKIEIITGKTSKKKMIKIIN